MTVEDGVRVGVGIFSVFDVGTVVITGDADIAGVGVEIRVGVMEGILARVGVGVGPECWRSIHPVKTIAIINTGTRIFL